MGRHAGLYWRSIKRLGKAKAILLLVMEKKSEQSRLDEPLLQPQREVEHGTLGSQMNRLLNNYAIVWWRNRMLSWTNGFVASQWGSYNVSESWRRGGNRGITSQSFSRSQSFTEPRE